jgi:hypothetical protein
LNDNEQRLKIELMENQIAQTRQQIRWETYKALSIIIGGIIGTSAAMLTAILALAAWLSQHGLFAHP